jgi:hypothetical protein
MLNFLFWNLNRRILINHLVNLIVGHDLDFLFLAECHVPIGSLIERLSARGKSYYEVSGLPETLGGISRFGPEHLRRQFDSPNLRLSVRRLVHPEHLEILIVVAHLPSQLYNSRASMDMECVALSRIIRDEEGKAGHNRTLLVGDLNVNPFNDGVLGTHGLHAVMTKDLASRQGRTVKGMTYPFFYNPMWSHFGDGSDGPPGTYFYARGEAVESFWQMFDQVLLRPELAAVFNPQELRILTEAGPLSLVSVSGRPDTNRSSDHLPVFFKINI